jgi:peptidyl-prolyl cis-trans isomerase A (cyclophilin A)
MKPSTTIAGAGLSAMLIAACAGSAFAQAKQTPPPKAPSKSSAPAKSATAPSYDKALLNPAALTAKAPDEYEVRFMTSKGDFTIKVTRAWSPNGADRFYNLVKHHFYDSAPFYRAVPGFMVQFGISAYPAVTKAWANATIKDDKVAQSNKPGYITFAMTGQPNSRTTELFIGLRDNGYLDSQGFAPFGQVTSGMEVVQQIYTGYGDMPAMGGHGPDPSLLGNQGKAYIEKNFPKIDSIKTITITSPAPVAPATKTPSKTSSIDPSKKSH